MSIEKKVFKSVVPAENFTEVQNWLSVNAAEYFDSFDTDSSGITMNMNGGSSVSVQPGGSTTVKIYLSSQNGGGSAALGQKHSSIKGYIEYAVKTAHGIVLTANENDLRIFITKSNVGSTSVYAMSKVYVNSTSTESWQMIAADLENSKTFTKTPYLQAVSNEPKIINAGYYWWSNDSASEVTVLLPFVFVGGTYAQNMFITPFSQYPKTVCILDINGEKYFYDGYVALKE